MPRKNIDAPPPLPPPLPPLGRKSYSIRQLGRAWKKVHPGDYDELEDSQLGRAVKKVFPGDYEIFLPDAEEALSRPYTPAGSVTRAEENLSKIPPGLGGAASTDPRVATPQAPAPGGALPPPMQFIAATGGEPSSIQPASLPGGGNPPLDPSGFPIDTTRPVIPNPDGSVSTESTIGVNIDGREFLIPTIVNGKRVSVEEAIADFERRREAGWVFANFATREEAEIAARERSSAIAKVYGLPGAGGPPLRAEQQAREPQRKGEPGAGGLPLQAEQQAREERAATAEKAVSLSPQTADKPTPERKSEPEARGLPPASSAEVISLQAEQKERGEGRQRPSIMEALDEFSPRHLISPEPALKEAIPEDLLEQIRFWDIPLGAEPSAPYSMYTPEGERGARQAARVLADFLGPQALGFMKGAGLLSQGLKWTANLPRITEFLKNSKNMLRAVDVFAETGVQAGIAAMAGKQGIESLEGFLDAAERDDHEEAAAHLNALAINFGLGGAAFFYGGLKAETVLRRQPGPLPKTPKARETARVRALDESSQAAARGERLTARQWLLEANKVAPEKWRGIFGEEIPVNLNGQAALIKFKGTSGQRPIFDLVNVRTGELLTTGDGGSVQAFIRAMLDRTKPVRTAPPPIEQRAAKAELKSLEGRQEIEVAQRAVADLKEMNLHWHKKRNYIDSLIPVKKGRSRSRKNRRRARQRESEGPFYQPLKAAEAELKSLEERQAVEDAPEPDLPAPIRAALHRSAAPQKQIAARPTPVEAETPVDKLQRGQAVEFKHTPIATPQVGRPAPKPMAERFVRGILEDVTRQGMVKITMQGGGSIDVPLEDVRLPVETETPMEAKPAPDSNLKKLEDMGERMVRDKQERLSKAEADSAQATAQGRDITGTLAGAREALESAKKFLADVQLKKPKAKAVLRKPKAAAKPPTPAKLAADFKPAGEVVDGRRVRSSTPNIGSIGATFNNPVELSGIREVRMSAFTLDEAGIPTDKASKVLAEKIRESGELNPLIVAVDEKGPYILEGSHRYDALKRLKAKSFPAVVVHEADLGATAARSALRAPEAKPVTVLRKPKATDGVNVQFQDLFKRARQDEYSNEPARRILTRKQVENAARRAGKLPDEFISDAQRSESRYSLTELPGETVVRRLTGSETSGRVITHNRFQLIDLGESLDDIRNRRKAARLMPKSSGIVAAGAAKPKPAPVDLQIDFPLAKGAGEGLRKLSKDPLIRKLVENAGITRVVVRPPYTFELSQEGGVTPQGEISINPNAQHVEDTFLHELGHVLWHRSSDTQRDTILGMVSKHRPLLTRNAPGYMRMFDEGKPDEGVAALFSEIKNLPKEDQRALSSVPEGKSFKDAFQAQRGVVAPEPEAKPVAAKGKTGPAKTWKELGSEGGYLNEQKVGELGRTVATHGERMLILKDVNGGKHRLPASMAIKALQNPIIDGYIRTVIIQPGEMHPPTLDEYTLNYLPDLKRELEALLEGQGEVELGPQQLGEGPAAPVAEVGAARPKAALRKPKAAPGGVLSTDQTLLRLDKEAVLPAAADEKPQGLYLTIGNKSPFEPDVVGNVRSVFKNNAQKPLVVPGEDRVEHVRFGSFGGGSPSAGVAALKKLSSTSEFERLRTARKADLVKELNQKYPGPDYSRFFDSYELLEAYGASLAREQGFDAIVQLDTSPRIAPNFVDFSEFVALRSSAITALPAQATGATGTPGKSFEVQLTSRVTEFMEKSHHDTFTQLTPPARVDILSEAIAAAIGEPTAKSEIYKSSYGSLRRFNEDATAAEVATGLAELPAVDQLVRDIGSDRQVRPSLLYDRVLADPATAKDLYGAAADTRGLDKIDEAEAKRVSTDVIDLVDELERRANFAVRLSPDKVPPEATRTLKRIAEVRANMKALQASVTRLETVRKRGDAEVAAKEERAAEKLAFTPIPEPKGGLPRKKLTKGERGLLLEQDTTRPVVSFRGGGDVLGALERLEKRGLAVEETKKLTPAGLELAEFMQKNKARLDAGIPIAEHPIPKQARIKVDTATKRLMTNTVDGVTWFTDGHFAFKGEPPKKFEINEHKPNIARVIESAQKNASVVKPIAFRDSDTGPTAGIGVVSFDLAAEDRWTRLPLPTVPATRGKRGKSDEFEIVSLNANYYDYAVAKYGPDLEWKQASKSEALTAYKEGELVAVIMPVTLVAGMATSPAIRAIRKRELEKGKSEASLAGTLRRRRHLEEGRGDTPDQKKFAKDIWDIEFDGNETPIEYIEKLRTTVKDEKGQSGTVYANAAVSWLIEHVTFRPGQEIEGFIHGSYVSRDDVLFFKKMRDDILALPKEDTTTEARESFRKFYSDLQRGLGGKKGVKVVVIMPGEDPMTVRRLVRHEAHHEEMKSWRLPDKEASEFVAHPLIQAVLPLLKEMGYDVSDAPRMAEEIGARLAEGPGEVYKPGPGPVPRGPDGVPLERVGGWGSMGWDLVDGMKLLSNYADARMETGTLGRSLLKAAPLAREIFRGRATPLAREIARGRIKAVSRIKEVPRDKSRSRGDGPARDYKRGEGPHEAGDAGRVLRQGREEGTPREGGEDLARNRRRNFDFAIEREENFKQTIRARTSLDKSDPKAVGEFFLGAIKSGHIDLGIGGSVDPQKIKEALSEGIEIGAEAANLWLDKFFTVTADRSLDMAEWARMWHTVRYLSEVYPPLRPIFERVLEYEQERQEKIALLGKILEAYFDLSRKDRKGLDNRLIGARMKGTNEINQKGLNPAQIYAFRAYRLAFDTAFRWMEDTVVYLATRGKLKSANLLDTRQDVAEAFLNADLGITDAELDSRTEYVWEALGDVRESRKMGYSPFTRFGNWKYGIVNVKEKKLEYWEARGNPLSAAARFRKIKKQYAKGLESGKYKERSVHEDTKQFPEVLEGLGGVNLAVLAKMAKVDPALWEALLPMADFLKQKGFAAHFTKSSEVKGFEGDLLRPTADYIVGISGHVSKVKMLIDMQGLIAKMPEQKGRLVGFAQRYINYMSTQRQELSGLRNLVFQLALGLHNLSAPVVNFTQPFLMTYPWLRQYASDTIVGIEMGTAAATVALATLRTHGKGFVLLDTSKLPQDVRKAVEDSITSGLLRAQLIEEAVGLASGPGQGRMRKVWKVSGKLFEVSERMNRLVSFIAAYRIYNRKIAGAKKGIIRAKGESWKHGRFLSEYEDALEFAKETVSITQLEYGKINRPAMMRGYTAPLAIFKTFTVGYIELQQRLYSSWVDANETALVTGQVQIDDPIAGMLSPGDGDGGWKPRPLRWWKKQGWQRLMMMSIIAGGIFSFPFTKDALNAISRVAEGLTGEKYDLELQFQLWLAEFTGPHIADAFVQGPSRYLGGPNISSRLSMGEPLGVGKRSVLDFLPVITIPMRAGAALIDFLFKGKSWRDAVIDAIPGSSLGAYLKAQKAEKEGYRDRRGYPRELPGGRTKFTRAEIFWIAFGWYTVAESQASDVRRLQRLVNRGAADPRQLFLDQFADAYIRGDSEKAEKVQQDLDKWNSSGALFGLLPARETTFRKVNISKKDIEDRMAAMMTPEYVRQLERTRLDKRKFFQEEREKLPGGMPPPESPAPRLVPPLQQ